MWGLIYASVPEREHRGGIEGVQDESLRTSDIGKSEVLSGMQSVVKRERDIWHDQLKQSRY